MYERKKRILIPSDKDMIKKFVDLLSAKTNKNLIWMALKFNAALGRLAEKQCVEKGEFLSKETTAGTVVG